MLFAINTCVQIRLMGLGAVLKTMESSITSRNVADILGINGVVSCA
jgi:hypothetical protein